MLAPEQNTRSRPLVTTDRAHFGVLEAQALDRVRELDVDAEVVAVELERVVPAQGALLLHVHQEPGHRRLDLQAPVHVARGMRLEANGGRGRGSRMFHVPLDASGDLSRCQAL
jgi:hypothetical protein